MNRGLKAFAVILSVGALLPARATHAQGSFSPGSKVVSVGVLSDEGTGAGGAFEYSLLAFTPTIRLGVGAFVGRFSATDGTSGFTATPMLASANLHLALPSVSALDLFAGASFGVVQTLFDDEPNVSRPDDSVLDAAAGINLGARYFITPSVGVALQLGFGDVPQVFAGLSSKF